MLHQEPQADAGFSPAAGPRPRHDSRRWRALSCGLLALASVLPYMASLHGGFVYDDHILVEAAGSTPSAWEDFLHGGLWRDLPAAGYYRPVLTLSFALDRFLGGGRPFVFHLTNLVLHLLLVLTGWRLLERYPPTRRLALAASLLFAVHPLHVEAVAWISGRGDLLAPLLGLLAWHAYLKGGWSGGRLAPPSRLWLMAAGLLFLLALLSKESAVALPGLVLLPLLAVWPGREKGKSPSQIWPAGVMVLVLVLALTLRLAALSGFRGAYGVDPLENPAAGLALPDRLATSAGAFITGLRLLIWPAHLTFDYGPPVLGPLHLATTDGVLSVAGFLGVVLLTVLVLLLGSRGRPTFLPLGYGLGWMLMAWLPVSSLGPLPGTLLGERFLLFPSWGWTVMVAALLAGLSRLFPQGGRGSVWGAAISRLFLIGLLLCFATLSSLRVPDWRSDQALLNAALAASPVSHRVHFFQGLRLYRRGRMADARQAFAACLAAAPTFSRAHEALARTFLRLGDRARAEAEARRAVATEPPVDALRSRYRVILAESLAGSQQRTEAEHLLGEAARLDPFSPTPLRLMGDLKFAAGDMDEAERAYRRALSRQPQDAVTLYNLAMTLSRQGREDEAAASLRRLSLLDDAPAATLFQLGLREEHLGRRRQAAAAFRAFLEEDQAQISAAMQREARRRLQDLEDQKE